MKQLSENFTLQELTRSDKASKMGLTKQFNPNVCVVVKLKAVCENILEPLRKHLGKPILISSGYRCPELNDAVGGASDSQHVVGEAVDFKVSGMKTTEIIKVIKELKLPVDQCIEEFGRWVHVSHQDNNRDEFLQAKKVKGKTVYSPFNI